MSSILRAAMTFVSITKGGLNATRVILGGIIRLHSYLGLLGLVLNLATMFLPTSWILSPFLSFLGFGAAGPVKASMAAWLQSYFWGGAVASGSWFSFLQAAGMGVIPMWVGLVVKVPLAVGGLLGFLPRFLGRA